MIQFRFAATVAGLLWAGSGLAAAPPLSRVAWIQGCWEASSPKRVVQESWTAPLGGSMIGVSRTVRGDSLVEYELVVLRERSGVITYEAHPSGQPVATFTARAVTDSSIVFSNPAHDYPQEIGYRLVGADSLIAWIDGTSKGKARRVEFPYARSGCRTPGAEPGQGQGPGPGRASGQDPTRQVFEAESSFAHTMIARDVKAFESFVAPDAIFFGRRGVMRGKAEVVTAWKPLFEGPKPPFSWMPEHVEVLESGTLGHSSGPVKNLEGKLIGRFNSVWRLDPDGRWRIVFDKGCDVCDSTATR